jgi:lipoprotein-anchoring transpeptidase ErfK/SrfK
VQTLVSQQFALIGYDPFTDTSTAWSTSPEVIVTWLEAGASRLTVREATFKTFVDTLNTQINQNDPTVFIDADEAYQMVDDAIAQARPNIYLRLKHYPTEWTVRPNDTGFRIARYSGIPFYMIQEVNPGRDWEKPLSVGEKIKLPSVDLTLPHPPVPTKRIIVDLDNQVLVAFENGQEVFRWQIASGVYDAPTSPGVYQILSHNELAYGSSYTLCGDAGCAQWKMWWFMGMYEVFPGMMNGFHGWVELPNGALLGDGNVGTPATFGCVMSDQDNAKALYEWAQLGTVVEIVSSEYAPRSDLARQVYESPPA